MKKIAAALISFILIQNNFAQKIEILADGIHSSFRGMSVVDNHVIWVSGSNGMVGRSTNVGKTWMWRTVKGFEQTDFRDIEGFDGKTAVIMGIADPAYILRTTDGGRNWKVVFENTAPGMFLDAMEFWNDQSGIVIGDPVGNRFYIARTFDGGKTWQEVPGKYKPVSDKGEACFAASGTNIRKLNQSEAIFVSGGLSSHLFIRDKKIRLPILQGTESSGANSVAVKNRKIMMVVGGDFLKKDSSGQNCVFTNDGGNSWLRPKVPPGGYRSCVEYLAANNWITCGLNGVDLSQDNGMTWKNISKVGFHVCRRAKKGKAVFFAGPGGRVGKLL